MSYSVWQTKEIFEGIVGGYRFKNVQSMPPEDGVLWPSGVLIQFLSIKGSQFKVKPDFCFKLLDMNLSLVGKNALVGGASAGIGRAIAVELALLGANVTIMARNEQNLQATVSLLDTANGQSHQYLVADYSNNVELGQKVAALVAERTVHILVNNTGGPPGGPIENAAPEAFLSAYHNHLLCNHLLAQIVLTGMKNAGFGRIINVISTSVKEPIEGLGVSNTTRWAVASWAKTLASEVGSYGITVNNVLPGYTATARLEEILVKRMNASQLTREQVEEMMKSSVPARRFALPEEVAAAAAFLASPAAGYINGVNLPVDGGRTKSL